MTKADIEAEGVRALARYSENERVVECALARLATVATAIEHLRLSVVAMPGVDECRAVAETLEGRDLRAVAADLQAALARRADLEAALDAHGHGHMRRR